MEQKDRETDKPHHDKIRRKFALRALYECQSQLRAAIALIEIELED